jgi:hypothetical protein
MVPSEAKEITVGKEVFQIVDSPGLIGYRLRYAQAVESIHRGQTLRPIFGGAHLDQLTLRS